MYMRRGRPHYFYSDTDPTGLFSGARLLIGVLYVPFLIMAFFFIAQAFKGMKSPADNTIFITDNAQVIDNKDRLETSLEQFRERTGIVPCVLTLYNEDWQDGYSNLEDYAFDEYVKSYDDEMHWLIVYSQPRNPDPNDVDWYFEGMQGDDTDPILTTTAANRFTNDLNKRLEMDLGVGTSIAQAFDSFTPTVKKPGPGYKISQASPGVIMLAFLAFHAYFMLGLGNIKYRKAVLAPEDSVPVTDNMNNMNFDSSFGYSQGQTFQQQAGQAAQSGQSFYDPNTGTFYQPQSSYSAFEQASAEMESVQVPMKECPYCGGSCSVAERICPICGAKI